MPANTAAKLKIETHETTKTSRTFISRIFKTFLFLGFV